MATVALVSCKGVETIFASVDLAKKSVEFSCHKLEDKVTFAEDWDSGSFVIKAICPNNDIITIEEVHVFDRVTHL